MRGGSGWRVLVVGLAVGVWARGASAADLSRFPLCAPVTLPADGPARVRVPLELRSAEDPSDGTDLVIVDGAGREVPFARIEGYGQPERVPPAMVNATVEPGVFTVEPGPFPIDALEVTLPPSVMAARVSVARESDDASLAQDVLVWRLPNTSQAVVPLSSPVSELIVVRLAPVVDGVALGALGDGPTFTGLRGQPSAAPHTVEVDVDPAVLQDNGWARTEIALPRALPVDRVRVHAADVVYSRQAGLTDLDPFEVVRPDTLGAERYPDLPTTITRADLVGLTIETTTLPRSGSGVARLALLVDSRGQLPLDVTAVTVEVDAVELVVLTAGEGPHQVCGGAAPGTSMRSDLAVAVNELVRMAGPPVDAGPVADNPAWRPPELRSNLAVPSVPLTRERFRWQRQVTGAGLVRIPVPLDAALDARPDLGDLRLVSDGNQVPYVLAREPYDRAVEGVTVTRTEHGDETRLVVRLPERGLRVARIGLHTDALLFDREVRVSRPTNGHLRPLRAVRWIGADRPGTLTIEVDQPVDDELLVTIDNGDDPPLPLDDSVDVTVAGFELVAVLPDGGAELKYGDPSMGPPSYDLSLVYGSMRQRAAAVAEVGERRAAHRVPLTLFDRALLVIGVGVLALGTLGLAIDLVRRLPAAVKPPASPPSPPSAQAPPTPPTQPSEAPAAAG